MLVDRWASLDKFEGIDYVRLEEHLALRLNTCNLS